MYSVAKPLRGLACLLVFHLMLQAALNRISSNSAKEVKSKQGINTVGKCQSGPYVYDQNEHEEGIGSTFQHRKYSLIFADALRARWIGRLYNEHDIDAGNLAFNLFGLGDQNCQEKDLFQNSTNYLNFIYSNQTHILAPERPLIMPDIKKLCLIIQQNQTLFHLDDKMRRTVFVFSGDVLRQDLNYCLFNPHFRKRYYTKQKKRRVPFRPKNELWISVHFRWGDTATRSVYSPGVRTVAGIHKYIQATDRARKILSGLFDNKTIRIFFFSEGISSNFLSFSEKFPNDSLCINGNWTSAVDIMSQSNTIVGGSSSFFVLGSLLCRKCSVMSFAPSPKFDVSAVEGILSSHVQILPPYSLAG